MSSKTVCAQHALELGGHLRVGLEDYAGTASPTNRELVERAVELVRASGRPLATPADAARLLSLPDPERPATVRREAIVPDNVDE